MNVFEISVFTIVFHKVPRYRGFLVIKGVKVPDFLKDPISPPLPPGIMGWFLEAGKASKAWKTGLNTDGGNGFFHHLLQLYTLDFGKLFTHRGFC